MKASLVRLLAVALGLWLASAVLGRLWPLRSGGAGPASTDRTALGGGKGQPPARVPREPLTLLVIGSDADTLDAVGNGAAPAGPANSDTLLLIRFTPGQRLQVLSLPRELAVQIPGQKEILPLGRLYRVGGPALVAGVAGELVGLDPGQPSRYAIMPRRTLRQWVEALGGVELRLNRTYRYSDESQDLSIDLQGGRQRLNGIQAEHLARFQEGPEREEERRLRQEQLMRALVDELKQPGTQARLPALMPFLHGTTRTNLSEEESLSLLAAVIASEKSIEFDTLRLRAPRKAVSMRELEGKPGPDLWKRP